MSYQYGASSVIKDLLLELVFGGKLGGEYTMPRDEEMTGEAGRPIRACNPTEENIKGAEGDHRVREY